MAHRGTSSAFGLVMTGLGVGAVVVATGGCDRSTPKTDPVPRDTSQVTSPAQEPAAASARPSAEPSTRPEPSKAAPSEFPSHMMAHLEAVDALRDAIVAGDLAAAQGRARWLAEHPMAAELLPAWKPHFVKMQQNARRIVSADDLATAALGFGSMSEACGECHAEFAGPQYETQAPPSGKGTKGSMARHAWAAERMTLAVVAPSDALWKEGAGIFGKPTLREQELAKGMPSEVVPKVAELADWLHELGDPKSEVHEGKSRGEVLGELLATCNACHEIARAK